MKDSCSCGKIVYELDGRKVIEHDLTKDPVTYAEKTFDNYSEAERYYNAITGALTARGVIS